MSPEVLNKAIQPQASITAIAKVERVINDARKINKPIVIMCDMGYGSSEAELDLSELQISQAVTAMTNALASTRATFEKELAAL